MGLPVAGDRFGGRCDERAEIFGVVQQVVAVGAYGCGVWRSVLPAEPHVAGDARRDCLCDMERRGDRVGLAGGRRTVRPEARSAGPDRDGTHRCGGNRNQRLLEKRSTLTCNF